MMIINGCVTRLQRFVNQNLFLLFFAAETHLHEVCSFVPASTASTLWDPYYDIQRSNAPCLCRRTNQQQAHIHQQPILRPHLTSRAINTLQNARIRFTVNVAGAVHELPTQKQWSRGGKSRKWKRGAFRTSTAAPGPLTLPTCLRLCPFLAPGLDIFNLLQICRVLIRLINKGKMTV